MDDRARPGSRGMNAGRRTALPAQLAVLLAGLVLIALTWLGTLNALRTEELAALVRENANLTNKTMLFEIQIRRRLLAVEQTLRILEDEWERDPASFDLAYWKRQAKVLTDLALYMYITDQRGIVQLSSRPELVGADMSTHDAFQDRAARATDDGEMFIGAGALDPLTGRWQIPMARRLDTQNGRHFAGIIGLAYDSAVGSYFSAAELGSRGMVALVGTRHGRIHASAGSDIPRPGGSIADSALWDAMQAVPDGLWTGPSAPGGLVRMYAFRRVVDRPLAVVLGVDPAEVLESHYVWQRGAWTFAGGTTLFLLLGMAALTREMRATRNREARLAQDRMVLEEAHARQLAARELAEARTAQLDATLLGMSDGVLMVDADMRLVQWNARFFEYTGVPAAMLRVGVTMDEALRAQARLGEFGTVDVEAEVSRRMILLRSLSQMGVIERTRPNGRVIELRRRPLPDGGFVTLYADITERKRAEQALQGARETAEAAVAEKSRFVAIVSHEIRTPLNTLLNALTLLNSGKLLPGQRGVLGVARQSGDALLGLLDDILEMSRADAGQLTLRPSTFALRPLLLGVLEIFQDQAALRGVSLRLDCSAGMPDRLYTDPGRLRQVLMNLLSNAVKYSRPGLIVLAAVTQKRAGRTILRLSLRDRGPAIDAADRPRLFQPFSRLEQASSAFEADTGLPGSGLHSTGLTGTGLGLAICQRLTTLLGGEIGHLEATEDCNEFWITLPIVTAPQAAARIGVARPMLARSRVLLVDDIGANRDIIAMMLRREGHCVDVAANGAAAIAAVRQTPYDIVLMDIFMPDMSGLEAARILRGLGGLAGAVPIVALTANTGADDRARCLAAGMNDMLSKPVEVPTLLAAMARHAWPGHPARELARSGPASDDPASDGPLVDDLATTGALDGPRLAELRANLVPDLLARLVGQCLRDLADRLPTLQGAVADGRLGQIEAEGHAMAGMAGSYAMAALEARLRRLTLAARDADMATIIAAEAGMEEDLARTDAALRSILSLLPA